MSEKAPTLSREEYIEKAGISGEKLLEIEDALAEAAVMETFRDGITEEKRNELVRLERIIDDAKKLLRDNPTVNMFYMARGEVTLVNDGIGEAYSREEIIRKLKVVRELIDQNRENISGVEQAAYHQFEQEQDI